VTIDKFLLYWNLHNIAIIEGLVAIILVSSLFIAFRSFFSRPEDSAGSALDTAQIEKTLQKILEAQALAKTAAGKASAAVSDDLNVDIGMDIGGDSEKAGEALKELEQVRSKLVESQKQIEVLQAQVSAAPATASVEGLGAGNEEKIRELEARLSEYEIISEDIADLSRFKEENEKLKLELSQMRSKPAPAAAPAAPIAEAAPKPVAPEPPPVVAAPTPAPPPEQAPTPVPVAAAPAPAVEESPADSSLVDDELMKEFAAAVAGQQAQNGVMEKAGAGNTPTEKPTSETEKLMSEFETFVAKKS